MENAIERLAGYIVSKDIDTDICSKMDKQCNEDFEECVDCVIDHFNKECCWEKDGFCVNYNSEHCADFAFPSRCGACQYFSNSFQSITK